MRQPAKKGTTRQYSRREGVPEGFAAWSRIEELGSACGYHASGQFGPCGHWPCWSGGSWQIIRRQRRY